MCSAYFLTSGGLETTLLKYLCTEKTLISSSWLCMAILFHLDLLYKTNGNFIDSMYGRQLINSWKIYVCFFTQYTIND